MVYEEVLVMAIGRRCLAVLLAILPACFIDAPTYYVPDGDAGTDADPDAPPDVPSLLAPANGVFTGSSQDIAALRPIFRWRPIASADTYELQADDTCTIPDFSGCTFVSPEIDEVDITAESHRPSTPLPVSPFAPKGRRYFWRVRACNANGCSAWSAPRYMNVGQQLNDFNADGFADRLVGNSDSNTGSAYVYEGEDAWATPSTIADATGIIDGAGVQGATVVAAVGDVNGDGRGDLVIAAPHGTCGMGEGDEAYLFLGSNQEPNLSLASLIEHPAIANGPDPCPGDFGRAIFGGGDLNGDGYSDFVIGASDEFGTGALQFGHAYVYFGRASWQSTVTSADVVLTDPLGQVGSMFGHTGSSEGDLDGDGYADIVIGSFGADRPEDGEGQVYVYRGRADWGSLPATIDTPDVTLDNPADETLGFFGLAVSSAGDLDGDGRADLAVGSPVRSNPELVEGAAYIYFGADELPATRESADVEIDHPLDEMNGAFGVPIDTAGDVNGDGLADMLVGANPQSGPSHAYLYLGRGEWPATVSASDAGFSDPLSAGATRFGSELSTLGDTDGDGFDDVAIGAEFGSNPESAEGNVFIWLGRTSWPTTLDVADLTLDNPNDAVDQNFGTALR